VSAKNRFRSNLTGRLAWLGLAWACLITVIAAAEPPAGKYVSFLACPIARDTGPVTDVCFLAEHNGERYALVNPPDWGVPQLKHRVLVEGRVAAGSFCGAITIEGRASVLPDIDNSCNTVLPFDGVTANDVVICCPLASSTYQRPPSWLMACPMTTPGETSPL